MANQLSRRIEQGEEVVVLSRYTGGTLPPKARTFRCSHGPGMHPAQEGTGIWGSWVSTGREDRIESYMIDAGSFAGTTTGGTDVAATLRQLRGT
jgi:hypothetical protein